MNWQAWSALAALAICGAAFGLERLSDWLASCGTFVRKDAAGG